MLLSTVCAVGGIILIWVLYPKAYNYPQVCAGVVGKATAGVQGKAVWVRGRVGEV